MIPGWSQNDPRMIPKSQKFDHNFFRKAKILIKNLMKKSCFPQKIMCVSQARVCVGQTHVCVGTAVWMACTRTLGTHQSPHHSPH